MDELGFFRLEGQADSDAEVQASLRRGTLNFLQPRLVKISTPYMRGGVLYEDFKNGFGKDNPDLLLWRASSLLMNPSLKAERLEREKRLNPQRFEREYMAEFADDLEAFLPSAWVEEAVIPDRHELPPQAGVWYFPAVDSCGGGADSFTLAVVRTEGEEADHRIIQDGRKGWSLSRNQQVNLEAVVKEDCRNAPALPAPRGWGDRYAAGWVREAFQREGIHYQDAEMTKAEAYMDMQPLFAQGRMDLVNHPRLVRELKLLEARPRAGGKTLVDHPRGGHDDYANSLEDPVRGGSLRCFAKAWRLNLSSSI